MLLAVVTFGGRVAWGIGRAQWLSGAEAMFGAGVGC
jgi:hypothetical protein